MSVSYISLLIFYFFNVSFPIIFYFTLIFFSSLSSTRNTNNLFFSLYQETLASTTYAIAAVAPCELHSSTTNYLSLSAFHFVRTKPCKNNPSTINFIMNYHCHFLYVFKIFKLGDVYSSINTKFKLLDVASTFLF